MKDNSIPKCCLCCTPTAVVGHADKMDFVCLMIIILIWILMCALNRFLNKELFKLNRWFPVYFKFHFQCNMNSPGDLITVGKPVFPWITLMCWCSAQLNGIDFGQKLRNYSKVYSITSSGRGSWIALLIWQSADWWWNCCCLRRKLFRVLYNS